jgi:hypothetical protein
MLQSSEKQRLLMVAVEKHNKMMEDCQNLKGACSFCCSLALHMTLLIYDLAVL